jgi:nucleotide-binding universal stress UspA family protein
MRRSIIVGVDGSDRATEAAREAASLARRLGRDLVLAHIAHDLPVFPYGDRRRHELQRRHLIQRGNDLLEGVAAEIGEPSARKRIALSGIVHGSAEDRLAALSREEHADLFVAGTRAPGSSAPASKKTAMRPHPFLRFHQGGEDAGYPALLLVSLVCLAMVVAGIVLVAITGTAWAFAWALLNLLGAIAILAAAILAALSDSDEASLEDVLGRSSSCR